MSIGNKVYFYGGSEYMGQYEFTGVGIVTEDGLNVQGIIYDIDILIQVCNIEVIA